MKKVFKMHPDFLTAEALKFATALKFYQILIRVFKTLSPIFKITLIFNHSSGERSIIYRDCSGKAKFGYLCKSVYKSLKNSGWYTFDNVRFYNSNYDGYITVNKTKII